MTVLGLTLRSAPGHGQTASGYLTYVGEHHDEIGSPNFEANSKLVCTTRSSKPGAQARRGSLPCRLRDRHVLVLRDSVENLPPATTERLMSWNLDRTRYQPCPM